MGARRKKRVWLGGVVLLMVLVAASPATSLAKSPVDGLEKLWATFPLGAPDDDQHAQTTPGSTLTETALVAPPSRGAIAVPGTGAEAPQQARSSGSTQPELASPSVVGGLVEDSTNSQIWIWVTLCGIAVVVLMLVTPIRGAIAAGPSKLFSRRSLRPPVPGRTAIAKSPLEGRPWVDERFEFCEIGHSRRGLREQVYARAVRGDGTEYVAARSATSWRRLRAAGAGKRRAAVETALIEQLSSEGWELVAPHERPGARRVLDGRPPTRDGLPASGGAQGAAPEVTP